MPSLITFNILSTVNAMTTAIAALLLLQTVLIEKINGADVTLKSQDSNWTQNIDPLSDSDSPVNSTSERFRRLIPYMTFYLTQGFLPQTPQQYSPIATVNNNLDGQIRYQPQNTAGTTSIPQAHPLQYPLLGNTYIVRPLPQQPQPHSQHQNYQQQPLPSPTPLPASGLSKYSSFPQQPVVRVPITRPNYYPVPKQIFPSLQYDFKPLFNKPQVTSIQNQPYQTESERLEQQVPDSRVPIAIQPQRQVYPKVVIQNYAPVKSIQYQTTSEDDQRQQYAKVSYQNYNPQKQLQLPTNEGKSGHESTYTKPVVKNYALLSQQYQGTDTIQQEDQQPTITNENNYDQTTRHLDQHSNRPSDEVMTIIQSHEIQVPQEETEQIKSDSETENLEDLLEGYQLSKTLPDRITSANIGSSIQTLSQILKLLQRASSLPGANKSLFTHTPSTEYNDKGSKLLQGYSPTRTEASTPGKAGIDYPNYSEIPPTRFNCKDQRYKGFFGDPETNCQVWHYCDLNGGQASFLCPNGTIFSQVVLTCDWWFNVKCASTAQLYVLNERLYKYILPVKPSFPEDYAGPLVDQYLTLKYYELEAKKKNATTKSSTTTTTTTEASLNNDYNPLHSLLTNEVKRKV
ncbi:uncharacterized protein LOC142334274 [Lycorma delicatula]|uniref:uncharacterized protein LOC142334274 n=1 Tax=Lycorma delicatula TaxID=130591 RepID=UPI003F5167AB